MGKVANILLHHPTAQAIDETHCVAKITKDGLTLHVGHATKAYINFTLWI